MGIYASTVMWESIMGSKTACKGLGSHELWYAHYDGKQSFTDYQEFGGWPKPSMKQFQGDVTVCGAGIDKNYRPWFMESYNCNCYNFIVFKYFL